MENVKRINRELKHKGKILEFYEDTMEMPGGITAKWDFLHHNGAAAVIPIDNDGKIFMVSQYRPGIEKMSLDKRWWKCNKMNGILLVETF